jgi:hypothetical protein
MGRLLGALGGLFVYLCIGTILAQLIIAGYAVSKGFLNQQKVTDMLAVARGAALSSAADELDGGQTKTLQMSSIEEQDQRRTTMTRHLELREQAVTSALEQIATERDKLAKERETFDLLVTAFRKKKEMTESLEVAKGQEDARAILENVKPKLAKDLILNMIKADEKEEVVAILSAMPIGKQKKIIEEFKTEEELKKFDEILRLIRQVDDKATSTTPPAATTVPGDVQQP